MYKLLLSVLFCCCFVTAFSQPKDPDPSFGTNGKVQAPANGLITKIVVQPDGKLLAAGVITKNNFNSVFLARYNRDGTPDVSFSDDGLLAETQLGYSAENDEVRVPVSIAVGSDKKIVMAGSSMTPPYGYDFAVFRFNADGTADNTFGGGGKVKTDIKEDANPFHTSDYASSVAVQTNGKIVVAGQFRSDAGTASWAKVIYNSNGTIYSKQRFYKQGGLSAFTPFVSALPDGGHAISVSPGFDYNFYSSNYDTKVVNYPGSGSNRAVAHRVLSDGSVVLLGRGTLPGASPGETYDGLYLARLTPDGNFDPGFSGDGFQAVDLYLGGGPNVATQTDGKIIVLNGSVLTRHNAGGSAEGSVSLPAGFNVFDMAISGKRLYVSNGSVIMALLVENAAAVEICNGVDDDSDGQIDEGLEQKTFYRDADEDGFGDPKNSVQACGKPEGYEANNTDCDDSDPKKGGSEIGCDGIDNDCNGKIDDVDLRILYKDADKDGWGDNASKGELLPYCLLNDGGPYAIQTGDCDDNDDTVNPQMPELCGDGKDNDCNGIIDDGCNGATIWYSDADNDGYGDNDLRNSVTAETQPDGYVANAGDCNDIDANINPNAVEVCDGRDNDCDGIVDGKCSGPIWHQDFDGDGYGDPDEYIQSEERPGGYVADSTDCNDGDGETNPGAAEICDGVDNNCDGKVDEGCAGTTWYRDADGDGFGNPQQTKISPTQPRGYVSNALDCNDKNKVKGGPEVCDGLDNDCDGFIDNGLEKKPFYSDFDGDGYGTPKRMVMACAAPPRFVANSQDCNDDNKNVYPGAPELCDGRDNDCDGVIDEGFDKTTFYHDFDKDGYGRAEVTLQACAAPLNYVAKAGDCNDRDSAIHPGAVGAPNDGIDNNCNGLIDEPLQNVATQKGQEVTGEQKLAVQLTAAPNPATHYFTLRIESASTKTVQLRIVDALGRVVETKRGLASNVTIPIGHNYRPGVYYAEVVQEGKTATLKLVKQTP